MEQALVKLIPRVEGINTFRVSAGHFACVRVVSRNHYRHPHRSARFPQRVRFRAAPPEKVTGRARKGPACPRFRFVLVIPPRPKKIEMF